MREAAFPPPSRDPFYDVPDDVASSAPGTILKHRPPPSSVAALRSLPANIKGSYQLMYRTNDSFDNATATVVTVLVPYSADMGKVLSYQVAEDSPYIDCAPSYVIQKNEVTAGAPGSILTQSEFIIIELALSQGWVVVVPDFQGPDSAFLANKLAGQAVLDGLRATLNSADLTGVEKDARLAMWGYSGGSLATAWAAELLADYAPELNVAGAALGGTVPSIEKVVKTVNKTPYAGLVPSGVLGLANAFPVIRKAVDEQIKPQYTRLFDRFQKQCLVSIVLQNIGKDVLGYLKDAQSLFEGSVGEVVKSNNLGKAIPKIPLYLYKSINDQVSEIEDTDDLYDYYCDGGATVEYLRDFASEHSILAITGAPQALSRVKMLLNGQKPKSGCSKRSVLSTALSGDSLQSLPDFALEAFKGLLGGKIGL